MKLLNIFVTTIYNKYICLHTHTATFVATCVWGMWILLKLGVYGNFIHYLFATLLFRFIHIIHSCMNLSVPYFFIFARKLTKKKTCKVKTLFQFHMCIFILYTDFQQDHHHHHQQQQLFLFLLYIFLFSSFLAGISFSILSLFIFLFICV